MKGWNFPGSSGSTTLLLKAGAFIPHSPVRELLPWADPKALPRCSLRFPRSTLGPRSPPGPGPVPPAPWRYKIPSVSPQVAANTEKFIRPPGGASPEGCEATRATRAGGLGPAEVTPAGSGMVMGAAEVTPAGSGVLMAPGGAALEGRAGTRWILFSTSLPHPEPPQSQIVTCGTQV